MLEVMQCQGFFSAAMNAHHPFDEHLAEGITDPRQLGLKKYRRKCVPVCWCAMCNRLLG
jgi:hypothetical protein